MRRLMRSLLIWFIIILVIAAAANSTIIWKILYPLPYQEEITNYSRQAGIDQYLVAAVARTESKFKTGAVSARGAVGIMQLMPETAQWIAARTGVEYDKEKLLEPGYNIRLGVLYLADLMDEFDNNIILALASYNGGRGRVKQWLTEKRWTGELETIDDIPYGETREFVRRVVKTYRIYRELYAQEM